MIPPTSPVSAPPLPAGGTLIRGLPRMPMEITVAGLIFEQLKREGVRTIYGIPGGPATPLFDALHGDAALRLVAPRHEAGAAFMALGDARVGGRLGVCLLTTGPGATNAITAVAAAKADGLPVLMLTAQTATSSFGKGSLQDSTESGVDTVALFRPITKMSAMLANPAAVGGQLRQAVRMAMTGRRGPVHLSIPTDLMRRPAAGAVLDPAQYRCEPRLFDREAVRRCARELLDARRPAILAGHGVNLSGAQPELLELAELLSIPVATTPKGKGAFPEKHPLSLRVFGLASSPLSERYLLSEETDALLVVGSSLHENSTSGWDPRLGTGVLMQQDVDPAMIGRNYPVAVALAGDAKTTLREILFELRRCLTRGESPFDGAREAFARFKAGGPEFLDCAAMRSDAQPIKPQRLMSELDSAMPKDTLIFLDVGNNTLWALHYMSATGRNAFIHNWGEFAAMGYGVAAAVGGKLAAPRRPVVAIVGDGGFAMAGMEVSTAVTENVPVVWVVLNDSRLNAIYHGQTLIYAKRTIGCQFHRMDIAKVAEGLGAVGRRIVSPEEIGPALTEALASGQPTVLDVWIDADEVPPIMSRVRSVEKLVGGMTVS